MSVNAKELEQPALQADLNRCKSDHGCQFVRVAQLDQSATLRRWRPQVQLLPWTPSFQGRDVIVSISACDADCAGANPAALTNFIFRWAESCRLSLKKGWLLTVREPLNANSAMRVRFPFAKTPFCGTTCPSSFLAGRRSWVIW